MDWTKLYVLALSRSQKKNIVYSWKTKSQFRHLVNPGIDMKVYNKYLIFPFFRHFQIMHILSSEPFLIIFPYIICKII